MRWLPLLILLLGCDPAIPDGNPAPASCGDIAEGEQAYFESDVEPILETYCAWCHWSDKEGEDRHAAPEAVNFDDYEYIKPNTFLTWARMKDGTMPPMGRMPSTEEYQTVLDFLSCLDAVREAELADDDDSSS